MAYGGDDRPENKGNTMTLVIEAGKVRMEARLNASRTARAVYEALPFEGKACLWGDEIYFEMPANLPPENPQAEAPSGTVAYWPPGRALCIFFGQTPYSPVNIIGRLCGNPEDFKAVKEGETVRVSKG
ncbi:MAG: cyclophilin-like fold protein [Planctomycetota bacterium]|nr:cyclophilin-like fold protein [Planctomycetota bacterium]